MRQVIELKNCPKPNLRERRYKLTLTSLALAIEYYNKKGDTEFVKEARSSLARHNSSLVCMVSKRVHDRVLNDLPVEAAVKDLLYG